MNFRIGAAALVALVLILGGCAAGAGNGNGVAPQTFDEEDLPQWILDLPEGDEPRDNDHTAQAALALFQASSTGDDERARELYQTVVEHAQAGIQEDPGNSQSYYQAGVAHLGLGNVDMAAEMFDRAEEIYPRYVLETEFLREGAWIDAYNEAVEHLMSDPPSAVPHLEQAHGIYQGRPEAMLQLAGLYAQDGRPDQAIELYGEAIDLVQGPRRNDIEDPEVLAAWDETLEVALFNQGQLLFQVGRFDEAATVYEQILEMFPDDLMALTNLAASLVSAGQADRAAGLYDELLSRPDLTARDYFIIGVGFYEAGDLEQAARAFGIAHESVPQDREALFNYTQTLYLAEDWEALVSAAERLIAIDTHNQNAYRFLIQGLANLDRQDELGPIFEQVESLPFEVAGLQMGHVPGGVAVAGQVTNLNEEPGSNVRLRVQFYSVDGAMAGSEEVTVTLGQVEEPVTFQADLGTDADVIGFRYEVLN